MKQKQLATIPFGEWLPDMPALGNPGLVAATGVIPDAASYRPLPALATVSTSALDTRCRGFSGGLESGGATRVYAGDAAKLYNLQNSVWTDVSRSGGYSTSSDNNWGFAQYGSKLVATNGDDPVQSITPGDPLFADMITSELKPTAQRVAVIGQFLVLGSTVDECDGVQRRRVWWSAIRNQTDFQPNAATQCDFQDMLEGGDVQALLGGTEYGLVFGQSAIHRMTYVGGSIVFRFDPIDRERGTLAPGSVVSVGRKAFFLTDEGFFLTDGQQSYPIGEGKVDDTFDALFAGGGLTSTATTAARRFRVSAGVDPVNKVVMWLFPSTSSATGTPDTLYMYNWVAQKWASASVSADVIGNSFTLGYTLEEIGALYPDLETVPFSLDSVSWTGGARLLAAFNTSKQYCTFTGSNLAATLDTGLIEFVPGRRSMVTKVRNHVDGGTVTTAVSSREQLSDSDSFDSAASEDGIGEHSQRNDGRYHKIRTSIAAAGTWEHAQGLEVEYVAKGRR